MATVEELVARSRAAQKQFEFATQEQADAICATVRSSYLHFGYEGRKSTAGNLAFPFAPSDVPFGPVYAFSVYHLLKVPNGRDLFPIELVEV